MFDTHTHLQFEVFEKNIDEFCYLARQSGVSKIMVVGTNLESSKNAVNLASQFNGIFASVGIHPHHVFQYLPTVIARSEATWPASQTQRGEQSPEKILNKRNLRPDGLQVQDDIEVLLNDPKILAVGETGMDKHVYKKTKYSNYTVSNDFLDLQRQFFILQIKLATKHKKSLVVHNRNAVDETIAVLKDNWSEVLAEKTVFHCCEPEQKLLDFAKEYGVFIGVDGDVTYDKDKQRFVKQIPLELLVLETDSPFLVPKDSTTPNTPSNLKLISQKVAEILKEEPEKIEKITFENSKKLFGINS